MPKPAINKLQLNYLNKQTKKATHDIVKYQVAPKIIIFPFTITLGTIMQSASGYETDNVSPKDFPAYQKIFTGLEQITVVWDGSVGVKGITDKTDGTFTGQDLHYDNSYTELEFKKNGDYFSGTLHSKTINTVFKQNSLNSNITNEIAIRSYAITIPNDNNFFQRTMLDETIRTKGLLDLQEWDFYKLFLVSDDTKNSEGFQWLYLDQISINMAPDNTVVSYDLILSSLSDRLAHTGATIDQLVQIMGAGCPASFPKVKWIENSEPIIMSEPAYLQRKGARALSIEYMAPTAFMSIMAHGRPYYKDSKKTKEATNGSTYFRFYAPRPLFVNNFFNAPNNPIAQVSSSNTTLTCFLKTQPTLEKWFQQLSNTWSNYYNQTDRGQEEGALNYNLSNTFPMKVFNDPLGAISSKSSQFEWNVDGTGARPLLDLTDPTFVLNLPSNTYTFTFFKPSSANNLVNCSLDFFARNPRSIDNVTRRTMTWKPADLMAFFALTNKLYTEVPMYYERTQIISGSDFFNNIGLGFLNRFSFGYNWGWNKAFGETIGLYIQEPVWINSNLGGYLRTEFLNASTTGKTNIKGFLPLFSFSDEASGALDQLISSKHTSLNIGGMLTDQMDANVYSIYNGVLQFGKTVSTVALGQVFSAAPDTTDPPLFVTYDYNSFQIKDPLPKFKDEDFNGYYVEQVFSRAYAKCNFTLQLYDGLPTQTFKKDGNVLTNKIYTGSFMTFSKYTNNVRNVVTSVRTAVLHKNYSGRTHPWPYNHHPNPSKQFKFLIKKTILYDDKDLITLAENRFYKKSGIYWFQNDFFNRDTKGGEIDGWSVPLSSRTIPSIYTAADYIDDEGKPKYKYIVIEGMRIMNIDKTFYIKGINYKLPKDGYVTATSKIINNKFSDKFWLVIDIQDLTNVKFIDVSKYFNINPFVQTWEVNRPFTSYQTAGDPKGCYNTKIARYPFVRGSSIPFYDGLTSDGYFKTIVAQPWWYFQQRSKNTFSLTFDDREQDVTKDNATDKFIYTKSLGDSKTLSAVAEHQVCRVGEPTYASWWIDTAPSFYEINFMEGWLTDDYEKVINNS